MHWMQRSKRDMYKGYHLLTEGIRKGYFFREKWYIRAEPSRTKNVLTTHPPFPAGNCQTA